MQNQQMRMKLLLLLLQQITKWLAVSEFFGRETYTDRLLN